MSSIQFSPADVFHSLDTRAKANSLYDALPLAFGGKALDAMYAELNRNDLFYLLTRTLTGVPRSVTDNEWVFARCREVQAAPYGHLDLWSREHFKSTIITFAHSIQEHLNDPETTTCIFSHTRGIAKTFLRQIMREYETNDELKRLHPEVLYEEPRRQAPKWSEDDGIICKRKGNPKECTFEAWGLVDGQPTSRHFKRRKYDDTVTLESVNTPEQIQKVNAAWEMSLNLGTVDGTEQYIGTRYHFNDTYKLIMERGLIPRVRLATLEPRLWDQTTIDAKRIKMGPFTFACHGAGTLITMADWSQKKIEDIAPGDEVVGWAQVNGSKSTLTPTCVVAVNKRVAPAVRSSLTNGDVLVHTPDHKWWTGRAPNPDRKPYSPLGFGYGQQRAVCQVLNVPACTPDPQGVEEYQAAGYLAGIIDGEGGVRHTTVQITQDPVIHPEVCAKIEWSLHTLGFSFGVWERERGTGTQRVYTVHGGREMRVRLLALCGSCLGKRLNIISQAYGAMDFGKGRRVSLDSQEDVGEVEVYNIQTETGNYVAGGYASKNCQILQNPVADSVMGFKKEWLRYYDPAMVRQGRGAQWWKALNRYLIVDPANSKKKYSDYTVFWLWGLAADGNKYLISGLRSRLNLAERTRWLFWFHRTFQPTAVGYEQYGLQADVEHVQGEMTRALYHFDIITLGGTMNKADRIRRLVPDFSAGRIYLPGQLSFPDHEGKVQDLTALFVDGEYLTFPVLEHDDMLDCASRIYEPALGAEHPQAQTDPKPFGEGGGRTDTTDSEWTPEAYR